MSVPFFYIETVSTVNTHIVLPEDTSRHIVQVLRMDVGEKLKLTDGLGNLYHAEITDAHKKKCSVRINEIESVPAPDKKNCIAISPLKNSNRFEWFLEKATELGIAEIIPIICTRTEKAHVRLDRLTGILVSAMLQSQQAWLPVLHEPLAFADCIKQTSYATKLMAHCEETGERINLHHAIKTDHAIMLIGPEGDFTDKEIASALGNGFVAITLGRNRLRTETAGVAAAVMLQMTGLQSG